MKETKQMSEASEINDGFDNYDTKSPRKKHKKRQDHKSYGKKDDREDRLTLTGVVEEALPGTWFKIKLSSGDVAVLATLSGKMRQNHIQILPGDNVIVEVSPYDTSRGRIVRRK